MTVAAGPGVAPAPDRSRLALALLLGAIVALSLGVYGAVHDPTGRSLVTLFFTATINLKVWLATAAVALAVFQVLTAAKFYGRLGRGHGPRWLGRVHRASGTLAFLLTSTSAFESPSDTGARESNAAYLSFRYFSTPVRSASLNPRP